jgi:AcrR family transcriptional regulator
MRTRKKTGSYSVGRARREAILDAAVERFKEGGYHRTSMQNIADDVGLTPHGLLHHFASKKALLFAVAEKRFDLLSAVALSQVDPSYGPHPDRIRYQDAASVFALLLEVTEHIAAEPGLIELFVLVSAQASDPESPEHRLYADRYEQIIHAIAQSFQALVEHGDIRGDFDARAAAEELVATLDGLQLQYVITSGATDIVAHMRRVLSRVAESAGVPWLAAAAADGSGNFLATDAAQKPRHS